MARTPAQTAALEKKALAEENKSEGMRSLFEAGYMVADVREVFDAPYGYVYGVARRWAETTGNEMPVEAVEPAAKPAKTKAAAKPAAKAAPKVAAKPAAKATAKPAAKTAARTKATAKA